MRNLFLALLFLPMLAISQPAARAQSGVFVPSMSPDATPPPPEPPREEFNPWRVSYFGEYQGPTLGNFDIRKTQYPGQAPFYAEWDHYLKFGYALSKNIIIGTQFRAFNLTDPNAINSGFGFYDQRFYVAWNKIINTDDVSIDGRFFVQPPTTDASRNAGQIITFRISAYVELKTPLRNWSFNCEFYLQPYFFNDPVSAGGQNDLAIYAKPYITVSVAPNAQILFEGSFDAAHNYNNAFYNYGSGDNDYFDIGPLFTLNSHIKVNTALRFFTDQISFNDAAVYFSVGVAL